MMRMLVPRFLVSAALTLLASCGGFWLDTYWHSERYLLLAIDTRSQMHLAFGQGDGTALGLVGATVFSVGSDERHIVVKQHPASNHSGDFERTLTNYFVVERTSSPSFAERQRRVYGPLSRAEFERLATEWSLPSFSQTFRDLE